MRAVLAVATSLLLIGFAVSTTINLIPANAAAPLTWTQIRGIKSAPGGTVTAVPIGGGNIQLFMANSHGDVVTNIGNGTSWNSNTWKSINEGRTKGGAPITAVPIGGGKIQLFLADLGGGVYTDVGSGLLNWNHWGPVNVHQLTKAGGWVTAIPLGAGKIQLFMANSHGEVFTDVGSDYNWNAHNDWKTVNQGSTKAGAPITAVPIGGGNIQLFLADPNGGIYSDQGSGYGPWHSWHPIVSPIAETAPGGHITAGFFGQNKISLFATNPAGEPHTTRGTGTGNDWAKYTTVNQGSTRPGAPITAVNLGGGSIRLFLADPNGGVYTDSGSGTNWHGWHYLDFLTNPGAQVTPVPIGGGKIQLFTVDAHGGVFTAITTG